MTESKTDFIVAYDYGNGGLWGLLRARSREEIESVFPELAILDEPPPWMSTERFAELASDPYDIDAPPRGMIEALVGERSKP